MICLALTVYISVQFYRISWLQLIVLVLKFLSMSAYPQQYKRAVTGHAEDLPAWSEE